MGDSLGHFAEATGEALWRGGFAVEGCLAGGGDRPGATTRRRYGAVRVTSLCRSQVSRLSGEDSGLKMSPGLSVAPKVLLFGQFWSKKSGQRTIQGKRKVPALSFFH